MKEIREASDSLLNILNVKLWKVVIWIVPLLRNKQNEYIEKKDKKLQQASIPRRTSAIYRKATVSGGSGAGNPYGGTPSNNLETPTSLNGSDVKVYIILIIQSRSNPFLSPPPPPFFFHFILFSHSISISSTYDQRACQ